MTLSDQDARHVAARWIHQVLLMRRPRDDATEISEASKHLSSRDLAFATLLYLTVLRRLGQIDDLIGRCLKRPLPRRAEFIRLVLRLGIAQLLFLDTPPHAAVDTSVKLTVAAGGRGYRGLVNAVLRRLGRDGADWRDSQDAARLNTPDWLWQSWSAAYGETIARAIAKAHLNEPPLDLTAKTNPADLAKLLDAKLLPCGSLRRKVGGRVEDLPGFNAGDWWVQDAAAALPARLLDVGSGDTVIDLCAAPGGKSAQLATSGVYVVAVDYSPKRLIQMHGNLYRLKLTGNDIETIEADAATWRPAEPAKFVLLDAPCTATGTIRRHPDIVHLKQPEDVARAVAAQERLLENAAGMLAPGGTLVYAVCSLQPEEGVKRIEAFLNTHDDFAREPIRPAEIGGLDEAITPAGDLRTLPSQLAELGGWDGFYAARLRRRA